MGRRGKQKEPVQVLLDRLEAKHTSGLDEQERRWKIRGAPVGARIEARPSRKQTARRLSLIEAAPNQVSPRCPVFGQCGGCQLQEMPLEAQREHKQNYVTRTILNPEHASTVQVHPIRGADAGFNYRNKLELSFGPRQFHAVAPAKDAPRETGSFLGFHPPGWFSKIVDIEGCPLGSKAMNEAITVLRSCHPHPAWDSLRHEGHWRHLILRDSGTEEQPRLLIGLVTTSTVDETQVRAAASNLSQVNGVTGIYWLTNDGKAEVATGELREVLHGSPELRFEVGGLQFTLPPSAFFQVNTAGTEVLLQVLSEAAGSGGSLVDLYCGSGIIGMSLASQFDQIIGIELHEGAIVCAQENAKANGVQGRWLAGKVEEVLPTLALPFPRTLVVDPPRVGLHPKAARALANLDADRLIYVSCKPESLARDAEILAEGGWKMEEIWIVDLFPQTHHVETIARFSKKSENKHLD